MIDRWPFRHGAALGLAAVTLLFMVVVGLLAAGASSVATAGDPFLGEYLYADHCAECHGWYAEGTLDAPGLLRPISRAEIETAVRDGVGTMASIPGYDAQDISDVTAFLTGSGYGFGEPPSLRSP